MPTQHLGEMVKQTVILGIGDDPVAIVAVLLTEGTANLFDLVQRRLMVFKWKHR